MKKINSDLIKKGPSHQKESSFYYQAYNFSIACPFACPELAPAQFEPTVNVEFGSVPVTLPEPRQVGGIFEARPGQFLLKLEGIGRYLVENGNQITIYPEDNTDEKDIRLFLLSTCLNIILLQKGEVLPLHASGVHTQSGAVLFAGYSGAGKSFLLSEFLGRGYTMLSDDIVPLHLGTQVSVTAFPAFPYVKLCGDAARVIGYDTSTLPLIRRDTRVDKFGIPISQFSQTAVGIRAIYILAPRGQSKIEIKEMDNSQKMQGLLYRTAGMPFMKGLGLRETHFKQVVQMASKLSIKKLFRPRDGKISGVRDLADVIEADLS